MAEDALEFVNDSFEPEPADARFVTLRLDAAFPVQANAGAVLFSKKSRTAKPWTVVAKGEVDNNKLTTAGETVTFPLLPGTFYALQFVGDAHALDPKAASVRVDVQVEVDGGHPVPLGGPKQVEQSSAGLRGAAFFHT